MLAALVALALVAAALTAAAALAAAASAREALRDLRAERRRERRERLEDAVGEVRRAALAYERAMERGSAADAGRAAERYAEACERLSGALAGGPPPGAAGALLPVLLDPSRPERVVRSGAAETVLAELARLRAAEEAAPVRPPWRVGLAADAARLRSGVRLARLGRLRPPGPPAAGTPRSPAPRG